MPSDSVSIREANLASAVVHGALYGVFFVFSITTLVLLAYRQGGRPFSASGTPRSLRGLWRNPLFLGSIVLFLTVTTHWIIAIRRVFEAYIYFQDGQAVDDYFLDVGRWSEVSIIGLMTLSLLTSDTMIIYRTLIMWNYNAWIIVFPALTTLAFAISGIGLTHQLTVMTPSEVDHWVTSTCVFTLCTNVYSTAMIAYRIFSASLRTSDTLDSGRSLMRALAILVESAALYTVWTLFFFISYEAHSALHYPSLNSWPAASGISFMLIAARIGLGWAHGRGGSSADAGPAIGAGPGAPTVGRSVSFSGYAHARKRKGRAAGAPPRSIVLSVTQTVEQEADFALTFPGKAMHDAEGAGGEDKGAALGDVAIARVEGGPPRGRFGSDSTCAEV